MRVRIVGETSVDSVIDVIDIHPSAIKPPLATFDGAMKDMVTGEVLYHEFDNFSSTPVDVEATTVQMRHPRIT